MPDVENAIEGVPSLDRKRAALARVAEEDFAGFPNWMKNWPYEQGEAYLDGLDFSNPVVIKNVFKKLWQMCVALRDVGKHYHEES